MLVLGVKTDPIETNIKDRQDNSPKQHLIQVLPSESFEEESEKNGHATEADPTELVEN